MDWLKLEAVAGLLQCHKEKRLSGYAPFPSLRLLVPEVLNDDEVEPILQAAPGHTFVHIKWHDPCVYTLKCSVFAAYLLHRRYKPEGDSVADWARLFSPEVTYKVSPVWPTTFDEPSREQNESDIIAGNKLIKWPDIADWNNSADCETLEPEEPEIKPPKKGRRVRKNFPKNRKNP